MKRLENFIKVLSSRDGSVKSCYWCVDRAEGNIGKDGPCE